MNENKGNNFKIIINGERINNVVFPVQFTNQIDEVLDSGNFSFYSRTINTNIEPFSECLLQVNNEEPSYWYASSECVYVMTEKFWRHNVLLLEPTKILEKYIVGSKAFSQLEGNKRTNRQLIEILLRLVADEFRVSFNLEDNNSRLDDLAFAREYVFGPGTTLFDCLLEFGKSMNAIPRLVNFYDLKFDYLDINEEYQLDYRRVSSDIINQKVDEYCQGFIADVNNVVDLDTTTIIDNLIAKSEDIQIKADTAKLILPTPIYDIRKIELKDITISRKIKTLGGTNNFKKNNKYTGTEVYNILYSACNWTREEANELFLNLQIKDDIIFTCTETDNNSIATLESINIENIDITPILLEKQNYNMQSAINITKYLYFEHGKNYIDGFNKIIGEKLFDGLAETGYPIYEFFKANYKKYDKPHSYFTFIEGDIEILIMDTYFNPYETTPNKIKQFKEKCLDLFLNSTFKIEYIPFINTKISYSRDGFKNIWRSYDNGANTAESQLLSTNMKARLNQTGNKERTIKLINPITEPRASNKIILDNISWYLTNVLKIIKPNKIEYSISMTKDFSRLSELIGVPSQYRSTPLPINEKIDRTVHFKYDKPEWMNSEELNQRLQEIEWASIKLENLQEKTTQYVLLPVIKMETDKFIQFIVYTEDNLTIGKQSANVSGFSIRHLKPINYYANAEVDILTIDIGYLVTRRKMEKINLTLEELRLLPIFDNDSYMINSSFFGQGAIYKDALERLIIVLQINK